MKKYFLPLASLLLVAPAVYGAGTDSAAIDAKAAFDRLRGLVGEWEAKMDQGRFRVTFEVIAAGSAVVEREIVENMPMETVYYLDGSRLLLTHYCILGNQPRMEARFYNPETGELKFEFLDVTNLAHSGAPHMHNATFRFTDADHLTGDWQLFENGKLKSTETIQLTRMRSTE
jgi:hypothetical protein